METKTALHREKEHIVWMDVVRLIAMFTVVCCHSADPFNFYAGETPPNIDDIKFWGAVYGAFLRPCVPLFVMLTGALLLPVKETDTYGFYKKRISRVFWPFLIWSVIYNLFPWITGILGLPPEIILDFFPYSGEEATRQSLEVSMGYIGLMPFNFSLLDVHMWYIYLLIGLYLYMPIFSAWVEKASNRASCGFLQHGESPCSCLTTGNLQTNISGEPAHGMSSTCCTTLPDSTAISCWDIICGTPTGAWARRWDGESRCLRQDLLSHFSASAISRCKKAALPNRWNCFSITARPMWC